MPRGLEPRISSLRGWRVRPVPLWHHINRQHFHSGSAPAHLSLTRTGTLNVSSRTIWFLFRAFPLQIIAGHCRLINHVALHEEVRQVTPITLPLIVWPLRSQSLRIGYGKLCSPSGREPTAYWRAAPYQTRTDDPRLTRTVLYQLS